MGATWGRSGEGVWEGGGRHFVATSAASTKVNKQQLRLYRSIFPCIFLQHPEL